MNQEKGHPLPVLFMLLDYWENRRRWIKGRHTKLNLKFPCLPWRGSYEMRNEHMPELREIVVSRAVEKQSVNWGTRRNPWIVGHTYTVNDSTKASEIFKMLFGYNLLQAFYRTAKKEGRAVNRNQRSMWCVPVADLEKIHFRYRATVWNKSERVPKNLQWLFELIYSQWVKRKKEADELFPVDGPEENAKKRNEFLRKFRPDYSGFDLGPDRLPPLYVCNLCGFKAEKEKWPYGQLMAGVAGNGILGCPQCKVKRGDMFDRVKDLVNGGKLFTPYMVWQDKYWFTL